MEEIGGKGAVTLAHFEENNYLITIIYFIVAFLLEYFLSVILNVGIHAGWTGTNVYHIS